MTELTATRSLRTSGTKVTPLAILGASALVYTIFLGTFLYLVGFVSGLFVPKSVSTGATAPLTEVLTVNIALIALFAIQHTIMARRPFKAWLCRYVHPALERSTFVLTTCGILILTFWQWRPLTGSVWAIENPLAAATLYTIEASGWAIVLLSTFLLDHFELFGLKQSFDYWRKRPPQAYSFKTPALYKAVRHPLMFGFMLAFWATPNMTTGRLLWCTVMTLYVFFGVMIEERDLVHAFGDRYRAYRRRVPAIIPLPRILHRRRA